MLQDLQCACPVDSRIYTCLGSALNVVGSRIHTCLGSALNVAAWMWENQTIIPYGVEQDSPPQLIIKMAFAVLAAHLLPWKASDQLLSYGPHGFTIKSWE